MKPAWRRKTLAAALAASLAMAPGARAQAPMIAVPVGPEVLAVPLLLLLLTLGMKMSQSDEKTVRELEKRGDWAAVVALADKRLAARADELTWREIRGRALQRSGRCELAMLDLRYAFERRVSAGGAAANDAAFQVGLALGLCEMQAWQLEAAAATMTRLAALAPTRWEPPYNLAVIAAQRSDAAAPARASARAASPAPLPAPLAMHPAVQLNQQQLRIGDRGMQLPAGAWTLQSSTSHSVRASEFRRAQLVDEVPLVTVRALATAPDGSLAAAVAFTANPQRAYGMAYWGGEDLCAVRDVLHVDRFRNSLNQPECVYVRLVSAEAVRDSPRLAPALAAAAQAGMPLPSWAYEIHYSLYGQDWMVASTWLLPASRLAGSLAAVQWARDLAAQMAPMARRADALPALVPPLGPAPG